MNLYHFTKRNILGNPFRSLVIFTVAALVASLAMTATFIVKGAQSSLQDNLSQLGADILVLPWGTMTENIEGIRLMSAPIDGWIPSSTMELLLSLEGVEQVSPQRYISSLDDSPYNPYPESHLVAFDPQTDFTLTPWLPKGWQESLALGDAIAGAYISLPNGEEPFELFGTIIHPRERLVPTETSIDHALFVSFETADLMVANSHGAISFIPETISVIMLRVAYGNNPHEVAVQILDEVSGVTPLETPNFFQTERQQMIGILRVFLASLGGIWALAVLFMGLVFAFAVNERRFEIGALRAIGFPSRLIFKILLVEGTILALVGGFLGVFLSILGLNFFGDQVGDILNLPISSPSTIGLISFSLGGQTLAFVSVTISALIPAWRISHEEVAMTMRE